MFSHLVPDFYYPDIFSIELDKLEQKGVQGIICDIDNTIVPYSDKKLITGARDWFKCLQERGFEVCLISNGRESRVKQFRDHLNLPAISLAVKPTKRAFLKATRDILQLEKHRVAVIGDQIFTDVLGGNRLNLVTVLVDPLEKKELLFTKLMRLVEKMVITRYDYSS